MLLSCEQSYTDIYSFNEPSETMYHTLTQLNDTVLKLDNSRLFHVGQNHTCMKHLWVDEPTHLHLVFKTHSVIKTSEAATILAHPRGWNQTREVWLTLRSANNLVPADRTRASPNRPQRGPEKVRFLRVCSPGFTLHNAAGNLWA